MELSKMSQTVTKQFEHRAVIPSTVERVRKFYSDPGAIAKLTPFPILVQVLKDDRESLTKGILDFRLWFGPIPVHWVAQHKPGQFPDTSFVDEMIEGPMEVWEHEHLFHSHEGGVEIIDRITFAHKQGWRGWFTRLFFDGLPLRMLFMYRHWRTKRETRA